jgi:phage repressor protein C with HTH and peptisase S24 domain
MSHDRYIIAFRHVNTIIAILETMDAIWFQQALRRTGASQADLARRLELPQSAISRILNGERRVQAGEVPGIAEFLGVPPDEVLRHVNAESGSPPREPARPGRPPNPRVAALPTGGDQMPIRSAGRGGPDQEMFLEDGPIGFTPRPANLGGVRDAYAIYMVGDSMEPRYIQGWLLHVNPFKPPIRGRDVVVYKVDQSVLIKQFVGWSGETLVLRQLNPAEELRIPRGEATECHLIVGVDQEA